MRYSGPMSDTKSVWKESPFPGFSSWKVTPFKLDLSLEANSLLKIVFLGFPVSFTKVHCCQLLIM